MKRLTAQIALICLTLSTSSVIGAEVETLGWILDRHNENRESVEINTNSYVEGFKDGYLAMLAVQTLGIIAEDAIDRSFFQDVSKCVQDEDNSVVYIELIAEARKSPDRKTRQWTAHYFVNKCHKELSDAADYLREGQK